MQLTAMEYDLLRELSIHAGRVLTHQHPAPTGGGEKGPSRQRPWTIRAHLMRLRCRQGEDGEYPKYIFADPRVGYRMERPDAPEGG